MRLRSILRLINRGQQLSIELLSHLSKEQINRALRTKNETWRHWTKN